MSEWSACVSMVWKYRSWTNMSVKGGPTGPCGSVKARAVHTRRFNVQRTRAEIRTIGPWYQKVRAEKVDLIVRAEIWSFRAAERSPMCSSLGIYGHGSMILKDPRIKFVGQLVKVVFSPRTPQTNLTYTRWPLYDRILITVCNYYRARTIMELYRCANLQVSWTKADAYPTYTWSNCAKLSV